MPIMEYSRAVKVLFADFCFDVLTAPDDMFKSDVLNEIRTMYYGYESNMSIKTVYNLALAKRNVSTDMECIKVLKEIFQFMNTSELLSDIAVTDLAGDDLINKLKELMKL